TPHGEARGREKTDRHGARKLHGPGSRWGWTRAARQGMVAASRGDTAGQHLAGFRAFVLTRRTTHVTFIRGAGEECGARRSCSSPIPRLHYAYCSPIGRGPYAHTACLFPPC